MKNVWEKIPSGRPDDPAKKGPEVRRVKPGETLRTFPLEDNVGWWLVHFLGQLTRPCLGPECLCHRAEKAIRTRWTGWILVAENFRPLSIKLLALTENCWTSCEELQRTDFPLRGRCLILRRNAKGNKGRVYASIDPDFSHAPSSLPRLPYTHRDQLLKLWFSGRFGYDEFNEYAHSEWVRPINLPADHNVPSNEERKEI